MTIMRMDRVSQLSDAVKQMALVNLMRNLISRPYCESLKESIQKMFNSVCDYPIEHDEAIKILINLKIINVDDDMAFYDAIDNNHTDIVEILLKIGANPSIGNNYPILKAIQNNNIKLTSILLKDIRIDPSFNNNLAIKLSSSLGRYDIVDMLLNDPRVDPASEDNRSIQAAAQNNKADVVKLLLSKIDVDPTSNDNFAIRKAVQNECTDTVRVLLSDPRIDPGEDNNYAVRCAVYNNNADILSMLLDDHRVDPSDDNQFCIRYASRYGFTDCVKLLLNHKKIDPTCYKYLPIKYAIEYNYSEIVKLFAFNNKVNITFDDNCITKFFAKHSDSETVSELLNDKRINKHDINSVLLCLMCNSSNPVINTILNFPKTDYTSNDNFLMKHCTKKRYHHTFQMLLNAPLTTEEIITDVLYYTMEQHFEEASKVILSSEKGLFIYNNSTIAKHAINNTYMSQMNKILTSPKLSSNCMRELLYYVINNNRIDALKLLMENPNVNLEVDKMNIIKCGIRTGKRRMLIRLLKGVILTPIQYDNLITYSNNHYCFKSSEIIDRAKTSLLEKKKNIH